MLSLLWALGLTVAAPPAPAPDVQAVVAANNQFAVDLYGRLGAEGNLFFSPYSIVKTLAMTYAGARGRTEQEMAAVLHFGLGQDRLHRAFRETRAVLNAADVPLPWQAPQLSLSANLWGQRGHGFRKEFVGLLHECYGAPLQEVDFGADAEQARRTINRWVEQQTHHKIHDLFPPHAIAPSTRLVLASAIHFKADWEHPFSKSAVRHDPFHVSARQQVQVPMMGRVGSFGYFEDDRLQALRMPYEGAGRAMVVLLPKDRGGLAGVEKGLTADRLAALLGSLREQDVDVTVPKFKLTGEFSLARTLEEMGMPSAFDARADFAGMDGGKGGLAITAVTHKAFVEVDEEGTEAAAATGVAVGALSAPPTMKPPVPVFRADHPFLFAITDVRAGLVLFLGRVARP